ncbi:hypothetical protein [Methylorubrum populi]|uniref:Uncharacterized protein n=1 Tax=Methylorubrum populi TaxID=223967 RepID=A0A833J4N6_9HYPH|nr:hypothetical protein [Methylorubrum populi]KAB7784059.1 hypothetical protein F8B43_3982 [Methylorubrum populi]
MTLATITAACALVGLILLIGPCLSDAQSKVAEAGYVRGLVMFGGACTCLVALVLAMVNGFVVRP